MLRKAVKEELYHCCDPSYLPFKTTDELPSLEETIGQERALRAIDFGLEIDDHGFNIYILGEGGTGKMTTIKNILKERAKDQPVPDDWCYVYNFRNPDEPKALSLPPGKGLSLQKDMDELIKALRQEIPKIFESKEYEKQRTKVLEEFQKKQKEYFLEIEKEAKEKDFSLRKTVGGLALLPVKKNS